MYVYEMLLKVAKMMMDVHEGSIPAAGTTTTITDTKLKYPADYFKDGTLWLTSGTYVGAYRVIGQTEGGLITFDTTLAAGPAINTTYAIAPSTFSLADMKQALNWVLEDSRYMLNDATDVTLENTEEYDLPTGVTHDVRRVEIATSTSAPYGWYKHKAWEIVNGKLIFMRFIPNSGMPIRYHYVGNMEALSALTTEIPITIDSNHLKWKTIAWLYRKYYDKTKEDHPEKTNLLTEAKMLAEMAAGSAGEPYLLPRDPIMGDVRA